MRIDSQMHVSATCARLPIASGTNRFEKVALKWAHVFLAKFNRNGTLAPCSAADIPSDPLIDRDQLRAVAGCETLKAPVINLRDFEPVPVVDMEWELNKAIAGVLARTDDFGLELVKEKRESAHVGRESDADVTGRATASCRFDGASDRHVLSMGQ